MIDFTASAVDLRRDYNFHGSGSIECFRPSSAPFIGYLWVAISLDGKK
jgi:hypothetical protein